MGEAEAIHMPKKRTEILPGTLDTLILKTLEGETLHGYAIARSIQQVSEDVLVVEEGSLYPALHRLERHGWICSEWGLSEANRRAKFYRLTRAGRRQIALQVAEWERLSGAMSKIIEHGGASA